MQLLQTKWVARFVRREGLAAGCLVEAIQRADRGLIDADIGGGLIKQRVARAGKGRSGGYRMMVAYRAGKRAIFLYAFAKNERENIDPEEIAELRTLGSNWLNSSSEQIQKAIEDGALQEVSYEQKEK